MAPVAPGGSCAQLVDGMTADDVTRRDHANKDDFINAFFDASAFVPVAQIPRGIYGNMPRGAVSGPAQANTDISVTRTLRASRT